MTIPCGARHRFFSHPSATEDLKIRITLSRQDLDNKLDETFMRNFFGYVADCEKHNMEPSPFQLSVESCSHVCCVALMHRVVACIFSTKATWSLLHRSTCRFLYSKLCTTVWYMESLADCWGRFAQRSPEGD